MNNVVQFSKVNGVPAKHHATGRLRLHPLQEKVYGHEPVNEAMVESIREFGIITPLIIDNEGQIVSGSRRWKAATKLNLNDVPVRRIDASPTEIEAMLLTANLQREKTAGQKAREATELLRIEKVRAAEREKAGIKTVGSHGAKGRASDIVAKLTGQGRATVEMQAEIVTKAEAGSKPAKEVLEKLDADECSLAAAHRTLKQWEKWEEEDKEREAEEAAEAELDETPRPVRDQAKQFDDFAEVLRDHAEHQRQKAISDSARIERLSRLFQVAEQIVSAGVKKLAVTRHPDVVGGSNEAMQLVNEAAQWMRGQITKSAPVGVSA